MFYRPPACRWHHPPLDSFRCVATTAARRSLSADFTELLTVSVSTYTASRSIKGSVLRRYPFIPLLGLSVLSKKGFYVYNHRILLYNVVYIGIYKGGFYETVIFQDANLYLFGYCGVLFCAWATFPSWHTPQHHVDYHWIALFDKPCMAESRRLAEPWRVEKGHTYW